MKTTVVLTIAALAAATPLRAQGPLTPPGAPAPVMKSLDQIEPRTPVSSLPLTILNPGSYYLTGNLQFTGTIGNAITISSSNVTLDLGGHTLSSTAAVTGHGISIAGGARNVTVRNGQVAGTTTVAITGTVPSRTWTVTVGGFDMGLSDAGSGTRIEDLSVSGCRVYGIDGSNTGACTLQRVTATGNGSIGIRANYGTLHQCVAIGNGGTGIYANYGVVTACQARDNQTNGIQAEGGTLNGCGSHQNGGHGISGSYSNLSGSNASYNAGDGIYAYYAAIDGGTVTHNTGDGAEMPYSTIRGTSASYNGGCGFNASYSSVQHATAFQNTGSGIYVTQGSVTGCSARDNSAATPAENFYATTSAVAFCRYPAGTTTGSTLTGNQTP